MLGKITKTITDLKDYVRCSIQSKAARYRVYYIETNIETSDDNVRTINFKLHPVHFEKDDFIGGLPAAEPMGKENIIETDETRDLLYDDVNNMIYVIEMRLFGGKSGREEASVIDARHHYNNKLKLMGSFLGKMASKESLIRIGYTRNAPAVMFKSIVGEPFIQGGVASEK